MFKWLKNLENKDRHFYIYQFTIQKVGFVGINKTLYSMYTRQCKQTWNTPSPNTCFPQKNHSVILVMTWTAFELNVSFDLVCSQSDSDLSQLQGIFPNTPTKTLQSTLQSSIRVEDAVNKLLNPGYTFYSICFTLLNVFPAQFFFHS